MKGYTDVPTIENYLLTEIDSGFVGQIEDWIASMEKYIDNSTGRNFIADSVATVRKYDGDNTSKLLIEDCVDVTEVKINGGDPLNFGESGEDDDYFLYPANDLPKNKIQLAGGLFPKYPFQGISVKGKWGFSVEVPDDIKQVCTVLVAGIINYGNSAEGEVKSMAIGRYNVTYKDEKQWQDFERVKEILDYYKKYNF